MIEHKQIREPLPPVKSKQVKRYHLWWRQNAAALIEDDSGNWVKFLDYNRLRSELEEVKRENERLKKGITSLVEHIDHEVLNHPQRPVATFGVRYYRQKLFELLFPNLKGGE